MTSGLHTTLHPQVGHVAATDKPTGPCLAHIWHLCNRRPYLNGPNTSVSWIPEDPWQPHVALGSLKQNPGNPNSLRIILLNIVEN
jgi:hypothetical protein